MEGERPPLRQTSSLQSTYQNSEYSNGFNRQEEDPLTMSTRSMQSVGSTRQTQTEMKIVAVEPDSIGIKPERRKDYKGRIRTWPGIVLLLAIVGTACALIIIGATSAREKSKELGLEYEENLTGSRRIRDGLNSSTDFVDDDGQVGNPKKYPEMGCELPDYLSKNGQIFARAKNGTEVPVGIKGVNWFGMETGLAIPFGLWENQNNGTTAYEIASFLARNKFNSVRLPVNIKNILNNVKPDPRLINMNTNRALNINSYMDLLKSIVKVLAYRHVTVMISLHTLDTRTSGGAWFDPSLDVTEAQFLKAVDTLTSNLCSSEYWNILGLDLKNEPHKCTWGSGDLDWRKGATLIGNRMLKGCPNWMAWIEGINDKHDIDTTNRPGTYFDWWGGGLQKARTHPITLQQKNKIVWAPHFYNTGVSPAFYLYANDNPTVEFVELDDATLKRNVYAVFEDMFGFLAKEQKEAVVLGEFAGLYGQDLHPKKTTMRTTDFTIDAALEMGLAGGYMWSLNPESEYQHNPANRMGRYFEGLLKMDWLTPNKVFVDGMARLDATRDLKMFPCFPIEKK